MLTIRDTVNGEPIKIHYCQSKEDCSRAYEWALKQKILGIDTESTGLNPYHPQWKLRTFQFGHATRAFVVPQQFRRWIARIWTIPDMFWIGHNGPHDVRSIDVHLGFETGVVCKGETYIPGHHSDGRNQEDGGVNHGLKEQCEAFVYRNAGKWERALKAEFKQIEIPIPGEIYKSGPRKGTQKYRKAKISEGWSLIDPTNRVYIAYAGSDPILTFRLWYYRRPVIEQFRDLYLFDREIQQIGDRLQRRGMRIDVEYTTHFREALDRKATRYARKAAVLGCDNIYSPVQLSAALIALGAKLTERTPTGKFKVDDKVLRSVIDGAPDTDAAKLARYVLTSKRLSKRREAYADAMLREMDATGRIHASINTLAARTTRMSVSHPALQQLPTKESE